MLYVLSKCWLLSLYLVHTKYILSIYFSDLVPKGPFARRSFCQKVLWTEGPFAKRSFGQKVLLEKVLWCKGPFDQRSFDFGGPLAKGPLEKLLCDKVLMLKVSLPQPIFDVWYNIAKKFQKSPFWGFCYIPYPYTRPPSDIFEINTSHPTVRHSAK